MKQIRRNKIYRRSLHGETAGEQHPGGLLECNESNPSMRMYRGPGGEERGCSSQAKAQKHHVINDGAAGLYEEAGRGNLEYPLYGRKKEEKTNYFGDYRPRYQEQYNIYEKAREHAKKQKKKVLTAQGKCDKLINVVATDKEVSTEQKQNEKSC